MSACRLEVDFTGNDVKRATRSQHGIRKARAIEIVEQGGSVFAVMSHLSHSEPKTSAIYTKRVDRAHLARQAADRVEAASSAEVQETPESAPRSSIRGTHVTREANGIELPKIKWQSLGESNPSFQVENLAS